MLKSNYTQAYARWYAYPEYATLLVRAHYKSASHQERQFASAYPEYVRARRNVTHLPNTYDDIYPSRWKATSWKDKTKHRKQWMHKLYP